MKPRFYLAVITLFFVTACATPDVKPFAEQTAALETAIVAEKKAVVDKMDGLIAQIEKGRSVEPPLTEIDKGTWESNKKSYLESMAVVTQVLSEATAYSDAVASLAAAGETGSAAADDVYKTVQGFVSLAASVGGPAVSIPAELAKSVAGRVFKEIGDLWTRYEAQKSLTEATRMAHPIIIKISAGVNGIFDDIHNDIIFSIYNEMKNAESSVLFTAAAKFHKKYGNDATLNALLRDVNALPLANLRAEFCLRGLLEQAARLRCLADSLDPATKDAIEDGDSARLETLAAESEAARHRIEFIYFLLAAVNETEDDHDRFLKARAETEEWNKTRAARSRALVKATQAWVKTHEELTTVLANCSGFKFLKASCRNLTAANLKAAIKRIKNLVGDDFDISAAVNE